MEWGLVARWLVVSLGLFAAGLPVAAALTPRLPDRGAGIALPLSLLVVGSVAYWVGHLAFGPIALGAGLLALAGASALAHRLGARPHGRRAVETALVFAVAFLFLVAVRAVDPAVHATMGEKFLDFSLLRALLRTEALPPLDPWFAGEPVRYYYGGHLLAALLARLTDIEARFAYNLALAGFYATLVTAAYGLAGALGDARGASRRTAGALGAFFVGFASNLYTPLRVLGAFLPESVAEAGAVLVGVRGFEAAGYRPVADFTYWGASRVVPGTINEFPLFAWLNGDLHAHMTSAPFLLLAATLCYAYFRTPAAAHPRRWALLAVLALDAGFVAVVNTWSLPTVLGLTWLALAFAPASPATLLPRTLGGAPRPDRRDSAGDSVEGSRGRRVARLGRELRRDGSALAVVVALALIALLVSLPFWTTSASARSVALVPPGDRSPMYALLVVHGGFLAAFVPLLARRTRAVAGDPRARRLAWGAAAGGIALWLLGFAALGLLLPLALCAWWLLRADPDDGTAFATLLILAAAGLVMLVDLVYVRERAGPGRMNTVFKTYAQVWVLWSPAAGAALAGLARSPGSTPVGASFRRAARGSFPGRIGARASRERGSGLTAGRVLVAALVLSMSVYGALALTDHFTANPGRYDAEAAEVYPRTDDPTLDALAFVETYHPDEYEAIRWLGAREGRPVVAAAPGLDSYGWTNAETTLTGLQTVAGWRHEVGYRGPEAYSARVEDADLIFTGTPAQRARLLDRYDVRYVYVGPNERERYGTVSFEDVPGVHVERRFEDVTIYEVERSAGDDPPSDAEER
ncbi:DUF2298 domain-containing protein [Halomarina pelagica]|uniref:DUF2298 domain-containing protein n=1 Tax=Halomarina pelagica TaxID=2961599 RepID=UPI0020C4E7AB|nr:DUF2298 domain-containing protein [Halomarina sp. BND7]